MKNINFTAIDIETANFDDDAPVRFGITIVKDGVSSKQEKAIKYESQGIDIEIMSENEFTDLF